jgi:HSP20 family molecular chaperone IbpA
MAENTTDQGPVPETRPDRTPGTREPERYLVPAVDIYETDNELTLVADVPGVEKDGLDIRIEDGVLTVHGRVPRRERENATSAEYDLLEYFRQFRLGSVVDPAHIRAELKHGVLTLHVPKAPQARRRQIKVQVAS